METLSLSPSTPELTSRIKDEKSQIQALDRKQPALPLRPGLPERQTHDYTRNGTTTLLPHGTCWKETVIGRGQPRHRLQGFLRFLVLAPVP
jgi:hypothetical protein